jgi:hypothetical protein
LSFLADEAIALGLADDIGTPAAAVAAIHTGPANQFLVGALPMANRNATSTALSTGTVRRDQAAAAVATIAWQTKAASSANPDEPNGPEYGPAHQWRRSDRFPARGAGPLNRGAHRRARASIWESADNG